MDNRELKSIIEGLLFTFGEPIESSELAKVLDMPTKDVHSILLEMKDEFDYNRRGVRIIRFNKSFQLGTRPEHHEWIKQIVQGRNTRSLSNAALETLSIVAYKQPVTKADIDHIRGVKSDRSLETLIGRRLVKEAGKLDKPGRPNLYGTTDEFLRYFGLESLEQLPPVDEFTIEEEE
ncbi:MAG TPA: SMC-Scp complex subunit ScpB [Tissierellaceae bacterium]|jgi:segregation and condensation protein B|nr:SMC-Scp complex subunit ScpB [Tissierellaceae bacterium]